MARGYSKAPKGKGGAIKKGTFGRLLKMLFTKNKALLITVLICIAFSSAVSVSSSLFLESLLTSIQKGLTVGLDGVWNDLISIFIIMGCVYGAGILCSFIYTRLMAILTQKFLHQIRTDMFDMMQYYPISFFDNNQTGNIMSVYTNDTDALRELVSRSIPQLCSSIISITTLIIIMLQSSIWLFLVVVLGAIAMFLVTKKIGGNSAKYFVKQQQSLGKTEGYIQEMMHGQKVVKVFCHEQESKEKFDKVNDELYENAKSAHTFANILMPIMGNLGNILYVLVAFIGGLLTVLNVPNLSITGIEPVDTISFLIVIIAFLPISKQFTMNVSQSSQQINSIIMGLAGASRIFDLMDVKP